MPDDPGSIDASQAVDLDPAKQQAALAAAKRKADEQEAAAKRVAAWERSMSRVFCGIMTRRSRRYWLHRALEKGVAS